MGDTQFIPADDPPNPTGGDVYVANQIDEAVDLAAATDDCVFAALAGGWSTSRPRRSPSTTVAAPTRPKRVSTPLDLQRSQSHAVATARATRRRAWQFSELPLSATKLPVYLAAGLHDQRPDAFDFDQYGLSELTALSAAGQEPVGSERISGVGPGSSVMQSSGRLASVLSLEQRRPKLRVVSGH